MVYEVLIWWFATLSIGCLGLLVGVLPKAPLHTTNQTQTGIMMLAPVAQPAMLAAAPAIPLLAQRIPTGLPCRHHTHKNETEYTHQHQIYNSTFTVCDSCAKKIYKELENAMRGKGDKATYPQYKRRSEVPYDTEMTINYDGKPIYTLGFNYKANEIKTAMAKVK